MDLPDAENLLHPAAKGTHSLDLNVMRLQLLTKYGKEQKEFVYRVYINLRRPLCTI